MTFSRHSADVFWTLKADCQNCVFICPDKLPWKNFIPGKKLSLIFFFSEWGAGGSFSEFCGKNGLLAENCQESCKIGTQSFQRNFLRRDMFSEKFPMNKFFQTLSVCLVFFVVFWHNYQNGVPVSRWIYCGIFLWLNNCLRTFFRIWAEYCRTLSTIFQPVVKVSLYLSTIIFSWRFFYLETYRQLGNFFGKSSGFFS